MAYYGDCDLPEFYSEERVKARKAHRCCECHRAIPKGSTYVRCAGKFDGVLFHEKQHVECRDFAAKVNLNYIGECAIPFGEVDVAMRTPEDYGLEFSDVANGLADEWARIKTLYPEVAA